VRGAVGLIWATLSSLFFDSMNDTLRAQTA
jgi:hypothetical protein